VLVDIHFDVRPQAPLGQSLLNLVASSGSAFTALVAENDQSLPLEGPPTNDATDLVDGAVTIIAGALGLSVPADLAAKLERPAVTVEPARRTDSDDDLALFEAFVAAGSGNRLSDRSNALTRQTLVDELLTDVDSLDELLDELIKVL
jgi:hypothetical protein